MSRATADPSRLPERSGAPLHRTLVIPTLDEVAAVPAVAVLAGEVLDRGIADRVVVVDGGSRDDTVATARTAGLDVVEAAQRPPGTPVLGKGDSIWRIADLDTDVLVFRDADVVGVGADDLDRLARAVTTEGVALAKGRFVRLQHRGGPPREVSGRITEFVARPLLGLLAPELSLPEPLSGQFAIRADVLADLPIVTRYGVDIGLVLDVAARFGPAAVASVELGSLTHRSKEDASLVAMAHDVAATIVGRRIGSSGTSDHLTTPDRHAMMDPTAASLVGTATGPVVEAGADVVDHRAARDARRDPAAEALACAGPDGPLVVRPPRRAWVANVTTPTETP